MTSPARFALLAAALLLPLFAGDEPEPRWIALNRAARQAREAKDYAKFRDALVELRPLLPGNSRIMYNLAAADAHLGQTDRALAELMDLANAGLIYEFQKDDELSALRSAPAFAAVLRQVDKNRAPVTHATLVSTLPERDILPEDIAYDAKTRRLFLASVTQCKIVTADGKLFAKTTWPVMALRIDPQRRLLWAATGYIPNCAHCDPADKDKSELLAFNLDTAAQQKRVASPVKGLLGDLTISRTGDLYASEGYNGAVLLLKANSDALERLDAPGEFRSPQTPALSADEHILFVPDYIRGIAAIDLKTRAVRWLQPARDIVLSGIDGFYRCGDRFLAVQNGIKPERLVLFSADFTRQEILEANSPWLGEPSHGTFVGDDFYFVANSGWDAYDDDGKRKSDIAPVTSEIRKMSVPLRATP